MIPVFGLDFSSRGGLRQAGSGTSNRQCQEWDVNMVKKLGKRQVSAKSGVHRADRCAPPGRNGDNPSAGAALNELFSRMACRTSLLAGRPITFIVAVLLIIIWAVSGPIFHFSDTWQLVINTSTTIITFLMVFLIQHTQNRDTLALQLKLAELIIAARGTENEIAAAEDLPEEELEELHEKYRQKAQTTLDTLKQRRGQELKEVS